MLCVFCQNNVRIPLKQDEACSEGCKGPPDKALLAQATFALISLATELGSAVGALLDSGALHLSESRNSGGTL